MLEKNIFKIVLIPLWVGLEMFVGPETRKISRCQPQHPRGTDTIPVRQSTLQKLRIKHFLTRDSCSPCDPARCSLPGTSPGRRRPQSSPDWAPACWQLRPGGSWTHRNIIKSRCYFVFNIKVPSFVRCGKSGMIRWQLLESDILNEKKFLTEIRVSQQGEEYLQNLKRGDNHGA